MQPARMPGPDQPRPLLRIASIAGLATVFVALVWRTLNFVDAHAVNALFWDQWDFYIPFFEGGGVWDIFSRQHGPHRQGFGFLITRGLAWLSDWNSRWDAFAVAIAMLFAALLAVRLATRLGMALGIGLAAIPLFFLNIRQYEGYVGSSNLSHGAMPMLLFMVYCLVWLHSGPRLRIAVLSFLNFLLIFTGFGIFVGVLTPALFVIELWHSRKGPERSLIFWLLGGLASCAGAWALFMVGHYKSDELLLTWPTTYGLFMSRMYANFFGLPTTHALAVPVGGLMVAALFGIALWHGWRVLRKGPDAGRLSVILVCLAAFELGYTLSTALARAEFSVVTGPAASRYVPLMVPGALAVLLQLGQIRSRTLSLCACLTLAALTAAGTLKLRKDDIETITWYSEGRRNWSAAYLRTHSVEQANKESNFRTHPLDVQERLDYLEQHRLNMFSTK